MAYIGVQPTDTYLSIASQQITGTGSATYTLDYSVSNEEDVAVFVNNVRQNVNTYTVSGTSLTLGGTISASDSCWILFLGRTVGTKTPAVGSVTNDMLAGSIATSKLADITANGITMADQWRLTVSFTGGATPIASNLVRINTNAQGTLGTGMTESSGIFTFPSTGIYYVTFTVLFNNVAADTSIEGHIMGTIDNGSYTYLATVRESLAGTSGENHQGTTSTLVDVTDTSNVKVRFDITSNAANNRIYGDLGANNTHMTFIRLGDT